jgi:hypothetical protein
MAEGPEKLGSKGMTKENTGNHKMSTFHADMKREATFQGAEDWISVLNNGRVPIQAKLWAQI